MLVEMFISEEITDILLFFLSELKKTNNGVEKDSTLSKKAFQTKNLCQENYLFPLLQQILNALPNNDGLRYRWFHMIDYESHGFQEAHDHSNTEDYSYILYLTTCQKGGSTILRLPNNEEIEIKPEKNKLVFFPANLWHWGTETIDKKKVAVGALVKASV